MLEFSASLAHDNSRFGAALTAVRTSNQTIVEGSVMAKARLCDVANCGKPFVARGMCAKHYSRWLSTADRGSVQHRSPSGAPIAWLKNHAGFEGDGCLTWPFGKRENGYGYINLPGRKLGVASREMCILAHGQPPTSRHQAAHSCGKGHQGCCNPRHLSWKTPEANIADKITHGTTQHGERNGQSKLTASSVEEIRSSPATGRPMAAKFGVSTATISLIRSGNRWAS